MQCPLVALGLGRDYCAAMLRRHAPPALAGTYGNRLLELLPRGDLLALAPHLRRRRFERGEWITGVGDTDDVHFIESGLASIVAEVNGKAVETCAVGREGGLNLVAALGAGETRAAGMMQVEGDVASLSMQAWREAVERSPAVRDLARRHAQMFVVLALRNVACAAQHSVEQRLCRKLVSSRDRTGSNEIRITQQFLADMLGVRRTSIVEVASKLQQARTIEYRHGLIRILDASALKACACDCYEAILASYAAIFPEVLRQRE
jgi:CRP-like cAMP-binding protein